MKSNYQMGSIGDIADLNPEQSNKEWQGREIHYIDISSVGVGIIQSNPEIMLYEEAPSRARRVIEAGDILISTVRPNRRSIVRLESVSENTLASTGFAVIRPKISSDSHFIFSICMDNSFTKKLSKVMNGAAYPSVSVQDILDIKIPIPNSKIRSRIATIAGNMDSYIALLRQRTVLIEERISRLYQSWFVEFEPVKRKLMQERPTNLDAKTAELFPSSLENSIMGKIPSGWKLTTVGEIANEKKENIDVNEMTPEMRYIGLEHMPRKSISITDWGRAGELASNKRKFSTRDVLFGKLRPNLHKVGFSPIDGVCSTDIIVMNSIEMNNRNLLLSIVSSEKFVRKMTSLSTGTRMPRVKGSDIEEYKIVLPEESIRNCFQRVTEPYIEMIQSNIIELRNIGELRTSLLHRLLIGKLKMTH
jgi:type I restriction enzyme S subunit